MSKIEVDTIDKQSGSTLTLGGPGTAVTLACGATQTGFGRTGTVNWCTTAKTSPFTATNGSGFFVNTSSGSVTVTLPASPSAGNIVSIADYTNTFQNNPVTIGRNGSKIGGVCSNAILNTEGQSVTFVYVDGTEGWKNVQDSTSNVTGNDHIIATGGTITTCGNFKIHTFTSDGTFTVTNADAAPKANVSYMVVAGGGGGSSAPSSNSGAGGGGGGFREGKTPATPYTASPIVAPAGLPVSVQAYPVTVGGGGTGNGGSSPWLGSNGSNSVFSTITSAGGGAGGSGASPGTPVAAGSDGGSGGAGGGGSTVSNNPGGAGNTPPVSPPQGNNGGGGLPAPGPGSDQASGGGGGATSAGSNSPDGRIGGAGGAAATTSITGTPTGFAGGAGGTGIPGAKGTPGGGGAGDSQQDSPATAATSGTANTGGAGGGAKGSQPAGAGGSGVVVIRYKFQ